MTEFLNSASLWLKHVFELYVASAPALAVLLALAAGVITSFTPCVYPMVPVTVSYIGAHGSGSRWKGFTLSLAYTLGMAVLYALLGLVFAGTGRSIGDLATTPIAYALIGALCIVFALSMFDVLVLDASRFGGKLQTKRFGSGHGGAFVAGLVFGLIAGPCTAPVLAFILTYVLKQGQVLYGTILTFAFGLGLGTLIIITGTFAGALTALPRSGAWMVKIKHGLAWVMLIAAALFFVQAGRRSVVQSAVIAGPTDSGSARIVVEPGKAERYRPPAEAQEGPSAGNIAPDFTVPTGRLQLSNLRSKVVLLAFWGST